ncbi:MAG: hypothetical protein ACI9FJ_002012 [Alteromonadaceae bacterium]|jgi:hypothetical protein
MKNRLLTFPTLNCFILCFSTFLSIFSSPLLERHMVRDRSPARTKIVVNKANSFGFSHSKAKGFNAVCGHFRLVLGNV